MQQHFDFNDLKMIESHGSKTQLSTIDTTDTGDRLLVDLGFILEIILEDMSMLKQHHFAWMEGWMYSKDLGKHLERKMAVNSWENGMRKALSVP